VEICLSKMRQGKWIDLGCNQAHGRTGTLLACLIAGNVQASDDSSEVPSWEPVDVEKLREQVLEWADGQEVEKEVLAQVEKLWPDEADDPSGGELLDRLAATIGLIEGTGLAVSTRRNGPSWRRGVVVLDSLVPPALRQAWTITNVGADDRAIDYAAALEADVAATLATLIQDVEDFGVFSTTVS
ncbi:hypothetical protein LCGC14_2649320, partial [marine sediment metagenome]